MSGGYHTYGPTCQLAPPPATSSNGRNAAPPIRAQFFYQSALPIDDPLSPLPPPASASSPSQRYPLRPFTGHDNAGLEAAWRSLDASLLRERDRERPRQDLPLDAKSQKDDHDARPVPFSSDLDHSRPDKELSTEKTAEDQPIVAQSRTENKKLRATRSFAPSRLRADDDGEKDRPFSSQDALGVPGVEAASSHRSQVAGSEALSYPPFKGLLLEKSTTGTPFLRAPLHPRQSQSPVRGAGAGSGMVETSNDEDSTTLPPSKRLSAHGGASPSVLPSSEKRQPPVEVPVGISRLHVVELPDLEMKPIYWSPLNDISSVMRGTWFYKETMLPVEADVANQLELGYLQLRPWTETWNDELNSAVAVGAEGEAKVTHRIWPKTTRKKPRARQHGDGRAPPEGVNSGDELAGPTSDEDGIGRTGAHARLFQDLGHVAAEARIEVASDKVKHYSNSSVLYKNHHEAFILRPSLLPSAYYGRRPVAKIRKGVAVGISVVRGFDWKAWYKIHPSKMSTTVARAWEGAAASAASAADATRANICHACWALEQPQKVTDLILVIHGIGQKLSERIESFHFTHLVNSLRRQIHVELGNSAVRSLMRPGHIGIMTLPINWRSTLSLEDGGPLPSNQSSDQSPTDNEFGLKDITPNSIPAVRNLISDIILDIPYYLSHHKAKMIEAVVREANRVYRLWCKNNPGFEKHGRVHLVAHSLGSVMALDILSKQPTQLPRHLDLHRAELNSRYFDFDTKNLFLCGSPAGFFVLLNRASLLPRKGRNKPGADGEDVGKGIAGEAGTYGCLAIDNIYNLLNQLDPIAYRLNATVDKDYAASLRPAFIPSASTSLFGSIGNAFRSLAPGGAAASSSGAGAANAALIDPASARPVASVTRRLPSTIELDIHDFSREEIAERRMYLLNENGQIDYYLTPSSGPLEIQYLNMLSAHSSYWASRDFVRFLVIETGRVPGRDATLPGMRAVKKGYGK